MDHQVGKLPGKRSKPTYINAIIMVAMVLFILGLMGLILLNADISARRIKENIRVSAYLKDGLNDITLMQLKKKIEAEPFVKSTEFISKEDAAKKFLELNEENIEEILGDYNPLPASIEIRLQASWVDSDSIAMISDMLQKHPEVKLVKSPGLLVSSMNKKFRTVGIVLVGIGILLFFIVVALIDKTIRLAMYSSRFIIRSMQLVGATRWFIVKPYVQRSILNGFISGLIAVGALMGILYYMNQQFHQLQLSGDYLKFGLLFLGIILFGILISWWSTHRAVSKYLRMRLDELY